MRTHQKTDADLVTDQFAHTILRVLIKENCQFINKHEEKHKLNGLSSKLASSKSHGIVRLRSACRQRMAATGPAPPLLQPNLPAQYLFFDRRAGSTTLSLCSVFLSFLICLSLPCWLGNRRNGSAMSGLDDMNKPVHVYILLGQSNMLGFGQIKGGDGSLEHAVKQEGLYPYLIDGNGAWTVRKDVRNVRVMGNGNGAMRVFTNEWMTIGGGKIGPEIGIGHVLGNYSEAPVMILKSCIGDRALGWDLLPPGSDGFEFTDHKGVTWEHPGYKGSPECWQKGTEPKKVKWYAGVQYDGDVARAKKVLSELNKYYPGAKKYIVAGFFWWQGDRDSLSDALSSRYEMNLVHLIKQLRKDFDAPVAKFVCASLGQTKKGAADGGGKILEAMLSVDGESGKYPEFKGNVAAVYTHPLSKGGRSGSHYDGNAETFMNVGEAMGEAMVKLREGV